MSASSTNLLLALPILVPLMAAVLGMLAGRSTRAQQGFALAGAAGLFAAALALLAAVWRHGILSSQMGGWPAPFGITLVADLFSAILLAVAATVGLAVTVYAVGSLDRQRAAFAFYPTVTTLLLGVAGAFLAGDLFNLYVWFEVLLISSFVLLAVQGERRQMKGAIRYFVLNLLSSALFLAALGILYGKIGTLNLADLARKIEAVGGGAGDGALSVVAVLFLVAFGLKAAIFPLFFWLPSAYPTPPVAVSALFAGLLTKVGVYALIRVFTLLFVHDPAFTHGLILALAVLTMVSGVLGAVAQDGVRRILSFHIVSQIGYMLMGLGLLTALGLAGAVFYIVHHIVVKTNLFLIGGLVRRVGTSGELARLGDLVRRAPWLAALFALAALSLAGLPPTSGFWAKLLLVRAAFESSSWTVGAAALLVSLLTLFSMSKIWIEAFWKPAPQTVRPAAPLGRREGFWLVTPVVFLAVVTVGIAVFAGPVFDVASRAAAELQDRDAYVAAVLGEAPAEWVDGVTDRVGDEAVSAQQNVPGGGS